MSLSIVSIEFAANGIGVVTAPVAAFFWWWASFTDIPPFPDVGFDSDSSVFEGVRSALRLASRRNAVAAFFAALAAASSAVTFVCQMVR
jgi:hypothetical protein